MALSMTFENPDESLQKCNSLMAGMEGCEETIAAIKSALNLVEGLDGLGKMEQVVIPKLSQVVTTFEQANAAWGEFKNDFHNNILVAAESDETVRDAEAEFAKAASQFE